MPTKARQLSAPKQPPVEVDVLIGAAAVGYNPEYLRKLIKSADPPPFRKRRGRWYADLPELLGWAERRDGGAA